MSTYVSLTDRELIDEATAAELRAQGVLSVDAERSLPVWFDGRFLAARDLLREQNYFLTRQGDMARGMGRGVIDGLEVYPSAAADGAGARLEILAGHGIAKSGTHLLLAEDLQIDLAELAVADGVNARLGTSSSPAVPAQNRSGLFVLSLRPVEFTANKIASYPTGTDGTRDLRDGDRIEAVAVTLTPFGVSEPAADSGTLRAAAARQIFRGGQDLQLAAHALPIAMIAMRLGKIDWIDMHMVRRTLTASRRDVLGLGLADDQRRLAHFHQYDMVFRELEQSYLETGRSPAWAAREAFRLLPAAGRMPRGAIDPVAFTQSYFPPEMEVELSLIPEDELPALLDDSFDLAPIDLDGGEALENVGVLVLVPVPRSLLASEISALQPLERQLRPAALYGWGHVKPLERIDVFRLSLADVTRAAQPPEPSATQSAWADLLARDVGIWYVRRRTLVRNLDLEDVLVPIVSEPVEEPGGGDGGGGDGDGGGDGGGGDPVPVPEPTPLELVLRRIEGYGDLAELAKEALEAGDDRAAALLDYYGSGTTADNPLQVAVALFRTEDSEIPPRQVLAILSDTPVKGWALLRAGLLGTAPGEVTERQAKTLAVLAVGEALPSFVNRLPGMAETDRLKAIDQLQELMEQGDAGAVNEFMAKTAGTGDSGPIIATRPSDPVSLVVTDRLVTADSAAAIADPVLARRIAALQAKPADANVQETLAKIMSAGNVGTSRIAMTTILANLEPLARLTLRAVTPLRVLDAATVEKLAKVETVLLPAATAASVRDPAAAKEDAQVAELVGQATRPVQVAAIADMAKRQAAAACDSIRKACLARGATAKSVAAAIDQIAAGG
ncbi:hypothetical protein [Mangrovicoccus sp. HB161399]|uniref:hypothetical protein n=1 Tax=Mangrovicoccus sp. HB161399 TaxID=2720392 RepID=UPI00155781E9|nr:hypothetical protein [Mangrovicoccus sp. HB161399]